MDHQIGLYLAFIRINPVVCNGLMTTENNERTNEYPMYIMASYKLLNGYRGLPNMYLNGKCLLFFQKSNKHRTPIPWRAAMHTINALKYGFKQRTLYG